MKLCIKIAFFWLLVMNPLQGEAAKFPNGPVAREQIFFQYAIYLTEPQKEDPKLQAQTLLKEKYSKFKITSQPDPKLPSVRISLNKKVQTEYAPPKIKSLRYSGKGISQEQAKKLQDVSSALIIDFAIPLKNRVFGIIEASKLVADVALATTGIIWDEETRQCFGRKEWISSRIESFENGIPDISEHITIHAYKDNEYIRAISLGMVKFGLPDIEVSDFSWSDNRQVGNLVNLFAQQLYEANNIQESGKFILNVNELKHPTIRKNTKESLYQNAEDKLTILIVNGIQDEGDPDNRIIEIVFDNYPGKNKQEKMEVMLSKLWGWKDELTQVKHNKQILEASKRAKSSLPSIRKKISNGLAPGEYFMVKAPFSTPDGGNEWMWVEIISWNNKNTITGLLKNQPYNIPTLKAGAEVTIKVDDIFDYIHRLPDGTSEGNETGKLIQKYSQ